jgi:hypothetical protein
MTHELVAGCTLHGTFGSARETSLTATKYSYSVAFVVHTIPKKEAANVSAKLAQRK